MNKARARICFCKFPLFFFWILFLSYLHRFLSDSLGPNVRFSVNENLSQKIISSFSGEELLHAKEDDNIKVHRCNDNILGARRDMNLEFYVYKVILYQISGT